MYNLGDYQVHECAGIPRYEFLSTGVIDEQEYISKKMKEAQVQYQKLSVREKALIEEMIEEKSKLELILAETIGSLEQKDLAEMMEEVMEDFKDVMPNDDLLKLFKSMTTEDPLSDAVIEEQIERFRGRKKEILNREGEF